MKLNILGADGNLINLNITDNNAEKHLNHPTSYINVIVNEQINRDKIYDFYFNGKSNLTIIDAGANVGMFSIHCSSVSKIIYSIEPTPSHFEILKSITKQFNNIKPLNCAIWKENTKLEFYEIGNNSTANSAVLSGGASRKILVDGKTIKTIIEENNIAHVDLLKMDIEGAEFEILTEDFIKYCYNVIDNMFIEVHPVHGYCGDFNSCQNRVKELFEKNNYKVKYNGNDGLFIYK